MSRAASDHVGLGRPALPAKAGKMEIVGWEAANAVLRVVGELDVEITRAQAELAEEMAKTKADYETAISERQAHRKTLIAALEAFAKAHKKEMPGKSINLTWGTLGFRAGKATIKFLWEADRIIAALRLRNLTDCIRVTEEPNKDDLHLLEEATLEKVGCKKGGGRDTFFVKIDLQKIKETP